MRKRTSVLLSRTLTKNAVALAAAAPALLLVVLSAVAAQRPAADTCNAARTAGVCYSFAESKAGNQFACKVMKGRYLASSQCSSVGALGSCTVKATPGSKAGDYSITYYPSPRFNLQSAQTDCESTTSALHAQGAGTWTSIGPSR